MPDQSDPLAEIPLVPEILVPRLGEYLVECGDITEQQLKQALSYQKKMAAKGELIRLGQTLRSLNMIDERTLDNAVTVQILQLHSALEQANQVLERRVEERTEELRKALDRLTELNQEKANFVANISHELRTPLTLLKGYLDVIAEEGLEGLPDSSKGVFRTMIKAEATLEKLIDDLIAFSYAERGKLDLQISPTRMDNLVQQCLKNCGIKAQIANVFLTSKISKKLPEAACDSLKISWVVEELLNNAIKFSPAGSTVSLTLEHHRGSVLLVVHDEGIGIPEDRIHEIFEPFHQLEGTSARRFGGTGLGLTLAQRILESHGSTMKVESTVGKGSSFRFALPAIPAGSE